MTDAVESRIFDTHVCLVSQQATPNLSPVLDTSFRPQRVVMVVTPDMRQQAKWLEDVLRERCRIRVERLDVRDAWDMNALLAQLIEWIDLQGVGLSIALNVTGGTKPMAMAAQRAFDKAGLAVFYVHPTSDQVQWLAPGLPAFTLNNKLKLDDYLQAHGWKVLARPAPMVAGPELQRLTQRLVLGIAERASAIGRLNAIASDCERSHRLWYTLTEQDIADQRLTATLADFEDAAACEVDGRTLRFPDEAARFFCNGGWLEEYVAETVRKLPADAGVQDWAASLKVRSVGNNLKGQGGSNELDVAILAHNRLHLIECKTRNLQSEGSAADALYKLDALTALGGLKTTTLLVSYRGELAPGDRQRAKDLGIQTCVGSQLATLRGTLLKWIKTRT